MHTLALKRARTLLLQSLLALPGLTFAQAASPPAPPPPWAELRPLGQDGEPALFEVKDAKAPLVWKGGPEGLTLVCFGGEGIALYCEQTYLPGNASVSPVLQKGVRITA